MLVRVIAGRAKGHGLQVPKGKGLRPTSDLVRGALFSALASLDARLERTLDLYAGTGALGIEALSRGADWCDFVEQNASACAAIRENLARTGFTERAKVYCLPVRTALRRLTGPYTLILADPPYDDRAATGLLAELATSPLVEHATILVLEHAWRQEVPEQRPPLSLVARRRYGDTALSIYRVTGGEL